VTAAARGGGGLRVLAASTTPGDRTRERLLVAAVAVTGTVLLASMRIARIGEFRAAAPPLAPFVAQPGLRFGVVLGGLLIVLPVLVFAVQVARAAARRAPARRRHPRPAAAHRGVADRRAGLLGGLLAGPGYLLLWAVSGVLPTAGFRLLRPPVAADIAVWALVVVAAGAAAALEGAATARGAGRRPVAHPGTRPRRAATGVRLLVWLLAMALLAVVLHPILLPAAAVLLGAVVFATPAVRLRTGRLARSGNPSTCSRRPGSRRRRARRAAWRSCCSCGSPPRCCRGCWPTPSTRNTCALREPRPAARFARNLDGMVAPAPASRRPIARVLPARPFAALVTMLAFTGLLYVTEAVDQLTPLYLDDDGIRPRAVDGLDGIVWAPLLHGGWGHLVANTVPFLVFGFLATAGGIRQFLVVTALIWLLGGLGVWLVAPGDSSTIGASGLIFGWLVFLLARGFFARSLRQIGLAVVLFAIWGGILFGVVPGQQGISWQAHLFGALAGLLAAWLVARADRGRRAGPSPTPSPTLR
jgi:membrane associated rhomboid family serine protease